METQRAKKKATNKELTNAVVDLNQRVNHLYNMVRGFDSIFTIYLEEKGDKSMLEGKLEQLQKEQEKKKNEQKANGESDKKDIPKNSGNAGSGTKGVRKEGK